MFGIGLGELIIIVLVAVVVFGPDKLPELAKQAGAMLRQLRKIADTARDELRDELGPEFADLELRDLDPRTIVRKHLAEAMNDEPGRATPTRPRATPRPGQLPLYDGERPPYDADAT